MESELKTSANRRSRALAVLAIAALTLSVHACGRADTTSVEETTGTSEQRVPATGPGTVPGTAVPEVVDTAPAPLSSEPAPAPAPTEPLTQPSEPIPVSPGPAPGPLPTDDSVNIPVEPIPSGPSGPSESAPGGPTVRFVGLSAGPTVHDLYPTDTSVRFGPAGTALYPYCETVYISDVPQPVQVQAVSIEGAPFAVLTGLEDCPGQGVPRCVAGTTLASVSRPGTPPGQGCQLGLGVPVPPPSESLWGVGHFDLSVTCTSADGSICGDPAVTNPTPNNPVIVQFPAATHSICYVAANATGCPPPRA